jgi:hypothetical protein
MIRASRSEELRFQMRLPNASTLGLLCLLALAATVVHLPLLLNDGVFWDGWIYYRHLLKGAWDPVYRPIRDAGYPEYAWAHRVLGAAPGVVAGYRAGALFAIIGCAWCVFFIGRWRDWLGEGEAALVALATVVSPAYAAAASLVTVPQIMAFAAFLLGVLLALRSQDAPGARHAAFRIAALVVFAAGFALASLAALYVGFVALLVFDAWRRGSPLARAIARHLDYIVWPVVYWTAKTRLFPRRGLYVDYNLPSLNAVAILERTGQWLTGAVAAPVARGLLEMGPEPLAWIAVAALTWVWTRWSYRRGGERPAAPVMVLGALALLLAAVPYAAVGKPARAEGWDVRHGLLAAPGVGLLLVGVSRALATPPRRWRRLLATSVSILVIASMAWTTAGDELAWAGRWAKDRAVVLQLSSRRDAARFPILWVADAMPRVGGEYYRPYEWAGLFDAAWGGPPHLGLDLSVHGPGALDEVRPTLNADYHLAGIALEGCQATLHVQAGPAWDGARRVGWRYLEARVLHASRLDALLRDLVRVAVWPIPGSCAGLPSG